MVPACEDIDNAGFWGVEVAGARDGLTFWIAEAKIPGSS